MLTSCSQLKALLNERPTPKSSFDACRLEAGITAPHAISWPSTHGFRTFLSKNQRWTVYRLPAEAGVPVRLTGRWWEFSFYSGHSRTVPDAAGSCRWKGVRLLRFDGDELREISGSCGLFVPVYPTTLSPRLRRCTVHVTGSSVTKFVWANSTPSWHPFVVGPQRTARLLVESPACRQGRAKAMKRRKSTAFIVAVPTLGEGSLYVPMQPRSSRYPPTKLVSGC
jgi:hypothetical protein